MVSINYSDLILNIFIKNVELKHIFKKKKKKNKKKKKKKKEIKKSKKFRILILIYKK